MKSCFVNPHFETLDDLLHESYKYILNDGKDSAGKRGSIREVNNYTATLTNSRSRTSLSLDRRLVRSKFAEFAWYLSMDSSKEYIVPYISLYNEEESENKKILGAYGPKIFGRKNGFLSQFERICQQLEIRRDTKQAYISISDSQDYSVKTEKHSSPPCTVGLHFLYRENALNLTTYMRSNDAYFGLPHDLFCFTTLQEMVAIKLGVTLGKYTHSCTSLHVYDIHFDRVEQYLEEGLFEHISMPPMESFNDEILQLVVRAYTSENLAMEELSQLPPYWHDFSLFSNQYFDKYSNQEQDWLSLFKTADLKRIAANSITQ